MTRAGPVGRIRCIVHTTFLERLKYYDNKKLSSRDELEICCEYTKVLGEIAKDECNAAYVLHERLSCLI